MFQLNYILIINYLLLVFQFISDEVYDSNVNNRKSVKSENGKLCELSPMLNSTNESDSDTPMPSPQPQRDSVSNMSYHYQLHAPTGEEETNDDMGNNHGINSENTKMSKKKYNLEDEILNNSKKTRFAEVHNKKEEVHYVNENIRDWSRM